jgi:hypothetical protein
MSIIFISGKFNDPDKIYGIEQNVLDAKRAARGCWLSGFDFVVTPHVLGAGLQFMPQMTNEDWLKRCLYFIEHNMRKENGDALLMLHDWQHSPGAVKENALAKKLGLKIYYVDQHGIPSPDDLV